VAFADDESQVIYCVGGLVEERGVVVGFVLLLTATSISPLDINNRPTSIIPLSGLLRRELDFAWWPGSFCGLSFHANPEERLAQSENTYQKIFAMPPLLFLLFFSNAPF